MDNCILLSLDKISLKIFYYLGFTSLLLGNDDVPVKWCFSQVKGTSEEEITEGIP